MTIWWLVLILAAILAGLAGFVWVALKLTRPDSMFGGPGFTPDQLADRAVDKVFNDAFREELKNRGRLQFEKIINENAMFLQQDIRLTSSQINDYLKGELTKKLREEFGRYETTIADAKQMAIASIEKTTAAVEEQRRQVSAQLLEGIERERAAAFKNFEDNMTKIINHYVIGAIGNQIDLNDQFEYIVKELEANKTAILEDINNGA